MTTVLLILRKKSFKRVKTTKEDDILNTGL